jgi:chromosome segregation ATPase
VPPAGMSERNNQASAVPVPVDDPAAREEARLRQRIGELREQVGLAAAELEELRATLGAFEARYEARVGVLIVELDRVGLEIERFRRRITAAQQSPEEQERVEQDIERELSAEQERIDTEAREAAAARERAACLPAPPAPDVAGAVKERYRKLARRFHPDVAASDEERARNEVAMKRINAAMESYDLDALEFIALSLPEPNTDIPGSSRSARIAWLSEEIARLEAVLARTAGTLAAVRAGSVHALWSRVEQNPALLDRLAAELSSELTAARMELHALRGDYEARLRVRARPGRLAGV